EYPLTVGKFLRRNREVKDVPPLEIPFFGDAEEPAEQLRFVMTDDRRDLVASPEVAGSFFPLGIGILSGIEAPFSCSHLPQHIGKDLFRHLPVKGNSGR